MTDFETPEKPTVRQDREYQSTGRRLEQDNVEKQNEAFSAGVLRATLLLLIIAAVLGYLFYRQAYYSAAPVPAPTTVTVTNTPAAAPVTATTAPVTNTAPTTTTP